MRRLAAILLLIAAPAFAAGPMFLAPSYLVSTPANPTCVALGDLNQDGRMDVVAGMPEGGIAIGLALGGGSVGPFTRWFTSHPVRSVHVADSDGDGKMDILCAGSLVVEPATMVVAYGDGAGGIADSFVVAESRPGTIAAAGDLDNDGRADLVFAPADTDSIAVYRSNANRTLTRAGAFAMVSFPDEVDLADLAGDSLLDVVVSYSGPTTFSVLPNLGGGAFAAREDHALPSSIRSLGFGHMTLPATNFWDMVTLGTNLVFWRSTGGASFISPRDLEVASTLVDFRIVDVNADGHPDVIGGRANVNPRDVTAILNQPNGGWNPLVRSSGSLYNVSGVAIGDVGGDGKVDAAWPAVSVPAVVLAPGNGNGTFGSRAELVTTSGTFRGVAAGDFDGDGDGDIIVNLNNQLYGIRMEGGLVDEVLPQSVSRIMPELVAGRFDSDANLDLAGLVDTAPPRLVYFPGIGSVVFGPPQDWALGAGPKRPTVADVDDDGKLDVVVPCKDANTLMVFLQGPSGLTAPVTVATEPAPVAVRYADLDGDAHRDRVTACAGKLVVELANGTGGYGAPAFVTLPTNPLDLALADLDEDGAVEALVLQDTGSGSPKMLVFKGHPGGAFDQQSTVDLDFLPGASSAPTARQIEVADFDGDGHEDAIFRDGTRAAVLGIRGRGDRTFDFPEAYATLAGVNGMGLADLNEDGRLDIAVAGIRSGAATVTVLASRNGQLVGTPPTAKGTVAFAITSLAPNPARGMIALTLDSPGAGRAHLAIHTAAGRIVRTQAGIPLAAGPNRVQLETAGLAPGLYWVRATSGGVSATRKLVVM
jgi:hypothetical protein